METVDPIVETLELPNEEEDEYILSLIEIEQSCSIVDTDELEQSPIHYKKGYHGRQKSETSTEMDAEYDVGEENT